MIEALILLLVGLVLVCLIIAANGYFVAQEFAYMSVDRAGLRVKAESGDASAKRALAITERTSFMLSGAQLGITVTGLLAGYVAEPFIGEGIGTLLGGAGVPSGVGVAAGTISALVLAAVVQMIFGELFPKNLAIANADPMARALARSTKIYLALFGWLITFFDKSSNALLKLVGVEPVHDVDSSATAEDLEHIVDESRDSGDLPDELSVLLDRILDFPDQDAQHAMISRSRVDTIEADTTIAEVREMMAGGHTRYPVLNDDDQPVGIVHLTDVLACPMDDGRPVSAIYREPVIIPTLMKLPDALEELTTSKNELACVIDEYGGFAGVLTIEDLAEELVGEITDEHDGDEAPVAEARSNDEWVIDGDMGVDEVERTIARDLPEGDYETLGGLVISEFGALPEVGERVRVDLPSEGSDMVDDIQYRWWLDIEVLELDGHVPGKVLLSMDKEQVTEDAGDEGSNA